MDPSRLDSIFAALANPTRRAILERLRAGEATVLELAEPFDMSQPAISRHLKVLEEAGLIMRGRDAQRRPCRLASGPFGEGADWLDGFTGDGRGRFPRVDILLDKLAAIDRKLGGGVEWSPPD